MKVLNSRLGPFPAWAVVVLLAAGFLGYRLYRARSVPQLGGLGQALTPDNQAGLISSMTGALSALTMAGGNRPGATGTVGPDSPGAINPKPTGSPSSSVYVPKPAPLGPVYASAAQAAGANYGVPTLTPIYASATPQAAANYGVPALTPVYADFSTAGLMARRQAITATYGK